MSRLFCIPDDIFHSCETSINHRELIALSSLSEELTPEQNTALMALINDRNLQKGRIPVQNQPCSPQAKLSLDELEDVLV